MYTIFKPFSTLTLDELYDLLQLRSSVFGVEQKSLYNDLDGVDKRAIHLLAYESSNSSLIGTARIYTTHNDTLAHFGRLCVAESVRGKQYGVLLLKEIMHKIEKEFSKKPLVISAQYYLKRFYEREGFRAEGAIYDEDGIDHIKMIYSSKLVGHH